MMFVAGTMAIAGPVQAIPPSIAVTTSPGLYPAFNTSVSDYVVRCDAVNPVGVSVTVPAGNEVLIDGANAHTTSFSTAVNITPGQSFAVTWVKSGGAGTSTYFVRCLPTDYPNFTSQRSGTPQAAYYVVVPSSLAAFSPTPPQQYITIFDNNGVPVWWLQEPAGYDGTLLPNGHVATNLAKADPPIQEHALDGTLIHAFSAVGDDTDHHEVQLLPNGNYLAAAVVTTTGDLSFMGGPSNAQIADNVVEELTSTGGLVWSWDPQTHIPLTETDPQWYDTILHPTGPSFGDGYDNYHFNSAQQLGNLVLVSFRHLDAVYLIDKPTGNIIWKLGGSKRAESLKITGDPVFQGKGSNGFGGQHYARFQGSSVQITLHDNGTGRNRSPRGVRYAINLTKRTASLQESISDPLATSAACCGSAARLPGGDWVSSWGFTPIVTELNSQGARQFLLQWTDNGEFSYRAEPVLPGVLSINALRSGMDVQFPR